jgi:hypothetical protein
MTELTLDGKIYVSSKRAAEMTGYAKDYVGQLCREGRVDARLVGRNWYVLKSAIEDHRFGESRKEEPAAEKEPETTVEDTSWKVRYQPEAVEPLPSINRLEASGTLSVSDIQTLSVPDADPALLAKMQSTWSDWFNRSNDTVVDTVISADEKADELPNVPAEETQEDENASKVKILTVADDMLETPQRVLDLHKDAPEEQIGQQDPFMELINDEQYVPNYRLLRTGLMAMIVIALLVGYMGIGLAPGSIASSTPARLIAGVSYYSY